MNSSAAVQEDVTCMIRYPYTMLRFEHGDESIHKVSSGLLRCTFSNMKSMASMSFTPTAVPQNDMLQNDIKIDMPDEHDAEVIVYDGWIRCRPPA